MSESLDLKSTILYNKGVIKKGENDMLTNLSVEQMGLLGWAAKQVEEAKRLAKKGGKR